MEQIKADEWQIPGKDTDLLLTMCRALARETWSEELQAYAVSDQFAIDRLTALQRRERPCTAWRFLLTGRTAGYAIVREEEEHVMLTDFYILPQMRGRGYGMQALKELLFIYEGRNISLTCTTDTAPFYERAGFRPNGRKDPESNTEIYVLIA